MQYFRTENIKSRFQGKKKAGPAGAGFLQNSFLLGDIDNLPVLKFIGRTYLPAHPSVL